MGSSRNWLKSLIGRKSAQIKDHKEGGGNGKRKWRLWRSSSGGSRLRGKNVAASEQSDSSVAADDGFFAAVSNICILLIGNWLKSLIGHKSAQIKDHKEGRGNGKRKWRLWRSSSEGSRLRGKNVAASEASDSSVAAGDGFSATVAAVVRAHPKDFMVVRQEWAAIRIQTAFRGLLARRALRALRALVRLQAIVRGRQVRKQAALTLRCMQALVRVQARVMAQSVNISSEQNISDHLQNLPDPIKQAEEGWCDGRGTVEQVRIKLQMRQEGAIKRERAISYSISQKHTRTNHCPYLRTSKSANSAKQQKHDNTNLSRLESWMAAKPWQNRLMEEAQTNRPEMTPLSRRSEDCSYPTGFRSNSSEHSILKPTRNNNSNLPIKMYPRSQVVGRISRSSSDPSSDFLYDRSSESTSSSSTNTAMEIVEENHMNKPNYMNLTESIKAKQKPSKYAPPPSPRPLMEDTQLQMKSMAISNGDTRSSAGVLYPIS